MALEDAFQPGSSPAPAPDDDAAPAAPAEGTEGTDEGTTAPAAAEAPAPTPYSSPQPSTGTALTPDARTYVDKMAAAGYSAEQISGGLGVHSYESGGNFSPTTVNPIGAVGISQDLGPRKAALLKYLNDNNLDPTVANETDFNLRELGGLEADADRQIRSANTVEDSAYAWSHHFERPGPVGEQKEIPYAISLGNKALPLVQARLAELAQGGRSGTQLAEAGGTASDAVNTPTASAVRAAAGTPAVDTSWDDALKTRARAVGQPDPTLPGPPSVDKVQLPATETSPVADPWADALRARDLARQNAAIAASKTPQQPQGGAPGTAAPGTSFPTRPLPDPHLVPEMLAGLKNAGAGIVRGVTDLLGTPGDLISSTSDYYTQHPAEAVAVATGVPLPPDLAAALPDQPGAVSPISKVIAPVTSKSITSGANIAGGAIGLGPHAFSSPAELGDYDVGHNAEFGLGRFIGASIDPMNPLGVIGMGRAAGLNIGRATLANETGIAAAGKQLVTHWAAPGAIAGGADAGGYLAGQLGGSPEEQRMAEMAIVPLTILGRAGIEGALAYSAEKGKTALGGIGGGKAAIFDNPSSASAALAPAVITKTFDEHLADVQAEQQQYADTYFDTHGTSAPGSTLLTAPDQISEAARRVQYAAGSRGFESGLPNPAAGLPEGYQVPGFTRSMDQGGQAFFQQTVHQDRLANGAYRDLLDNNTNVLHGALPGGDPADAVSYVRSLQDARQQTTDMRIATAQADADLAAKNASQSAAGNPLFVGAPGKAQLFDYGNELVRQLGAARDDAKAGVDDAWDVARQGGFSAATTDPRPIYNAIEGLAQKQIQGLQSPGTFPYKELAPLYQDGDLRGMFNAQGVRDPRTIGSGGTAGPNAVLQGPVSLDTLHNLESSLGDAARREQDAISSASGTGSPLRLRNINAVRSIVTQALERGTMEAGNYASMRNAMNATASYYNTFHNGIIGDILSSADSSLAPQKVATYLGNSTKAQAAAQEFQQALQARTGAAAAREAAPGTFDPAAPGMGSGLPGIGGNPGMTPGEGFRNAMADYMRQDYLLVRNEGGPGAGEKWAEKNGPVLNQYMTKDPTDPFTRLNEDVNRLNQSDAVLTNLPAQEARSQDAVEMKMAANFLGADEGKEFEAALRGQGQAAAMQRLVAMVRQDGTGQAFRGLQRMAFDRLMVAGQKFNQTNGELYYSGQAAQAYLNAHRGAYGVLRDADPVVGRNLDQIVNAMAADEMIRARPQVGELPKDLGAASAPMVTGTNPVTKVLGQFGDVLSRIGGAAFGRHLETGTIQVPGIMAEQAQRAWGAAYQSATGKVTPTQQAINDLREAMFDPAKTQAYLNAHMQDLQKQGLTFAIGKGAVSGAGAGHRAATGAAGINFTPGAAPQPSQPQATFSPAKPWVRGSLVEGAHSVLNSDETTPQRPHQFPVTRAPRKGAVGTPWDR